VNVSRTRLLPTSCFGFPSSVTAVDKYVLPFSEPAALDSFPHPVNTSSRPAPATAIIRIVTPYGRVGSAVCCTSNRDHRA
jgi:hypothetical protein